MYLTKNFTLAELAKNDHQRLEEMVKYANAKMTGDAERVRRLKTLATVLQSIRDFYGKPIRVTSGYRNPEYNAKVGGSPTSQHVQGWAADIKAGDGNMADLQRAVLQWASLHTDFDQIILEQPDAHGTASWIHFGCNHITKGRRKQILIAKRVNGKWQYSNYKG